PGGPPRHRCSTRSWRSARTGCWPAWIRRSSDSRTDEMEGGPMTHTDVQVWLDRYIAAWSSYDPEAIGALFADEAEYRYQTVADPVVGREAIGGGCGSAK